MIDWLLELIEERGPGCVFALVGLGIVAFLLYVAAITVASARVDRACLENGWAGSTVTWNLTPYCVKRVNQTDTVALLRDVRRLEK